MNLNQKILLIAVSVVVAGMLIFPPFNGRTGYGGIYNLGYSLILTPPIGGTVDVALLMTQWVGVLIVGTIVFFLLKDR